MKRRAFAAALAIMMSVCLMISVRPASAGAADVGDMVSISDAQIRSPLDGETYSINTKIPLKIYAGFIVYGAANWIQVSIEKNGNQVYWNCYNYKETTTEYDLGTFKPATSGTYTIKAGTTNSAVDSNPDSGEIRLVSSTRTFKVKTSSIKTIKPALTVKRTAKKRAALTWDTPTGARTQVWRAVKKTGKYKRLATISKSKYTDKSLAATKVYYYKIRFTKKEKGKTVYSKYSAIRKAGKYTPPAPFAITLKKTAKGVKITWGAWKGAGYYLVDRGTSNDGSGEVIACCGEKELEWLDTEIESGKTYYYRVTAWVGDEDKPRAKTKVVSIKY